VTDEEFFYREALGTFINLKTTYMQARASHIILSIEQSTIYANLNIVNSLQRIGHCHRLFSIDMKIEHYESSLGNLFLFEAIFGTPGGKYGEPASMQFLSAGDGVSRGGSNVVYQLWHE
jgi:hypothetical protein